MLLARATPDIQNGYGSPQCFTSQWLLHVQQRQVLPDVHEGAVRQEPPSRWRAQEPQDFRSPLREMFNVERDEELVVRWGTAFSSPDIPSSSED
jgi:hypothetical protein